jgi:hypothetical protein
MTAFQIGPMAVAFESDEPTLVSDAAAIHRGWETSRSADVLIRLSRDRSIEFGPRTPQTTRIGTTYHMAYWRWRARYDENRGVCEGAFGLEPQPGRDRERVQALVRTLLDRYLIHCDGVALHGASMTKNGKGYVFVGPSGIGKTTVVTRWPGEQVLGDDYAVIGKVAADYHIYGTPYTGREGTPSLPGRAPLSAIFVLNQSPVTSLFRLDRVQAFRTLMRQLIHFGGDREEVDGLLSRLTAVAENVPVWRLDFNLTTPIWPVIYEVLSSC